MKGHFRFMYRMNYNNCSTPRDRIDKKILSHISEQRRNYHTDHGKMRVADNDCACNDTRENQLNNSPHECDYDYENSDFDYSLAMVYSPNQEWQNIYCLEKGFISGTIFRELDKPFYGAKCYGGDCHE